MRSAKILSFDMDGTLTDVSFANSVWLEGIPHQYALKNGVSFEVAKKNVMSEYLKVGKERLEWYDPSYWTGRLGLDVSPKEILSSFQHRIKVFPEVIGVLQEFEDKGFRLVILTNAHREFADFELQKTKLMRYFERIFSSTSDFGLVKNTVEPYRRVCSICSVSPGEVVHVGDDERFDFDIPRKLGIRAFYLDRIGEHSGKFIVHSLTELSEKLAKSM